MTEIRRPVYMSGENPGMTLRASGTGELQAIASYWHCTDSPLGVGHAMILWTCQWGEQHDFHGVVLSDNRPLAKSLVETLTQHFPEFQGVPVLAFPCMEASCGHAFDGHSYRAYGRAKNLQIELEWAGLLDRKQVVWSRFPAGGAAFDLTTVICPCGSGRILVNGSPIEGQVETTEAPASSSAFLAFAETWIGPV